MINKLVTKALFSTYNILHGGKLRKYYREVKDHNDSSRPFNMERLRSYLQEWDLGSDITRLPVMTKADIRVHTSKLWDSDISSFVYTGGSTGDSLKVPYSKKRELMRTASIAYYNEIAGYEVGDPFLMIRAKQKSGIKQFLRNELLFVPTDISTDKIEAISKEIVRKKVSVLIGYPTVIYEIAAFIDNHENLKNSHSVQSIITVSEPLDDLKRLFIKTVFNCKLIDRYSNEETGVIAQQREYGGDYIVDKFGVFVEVLDQETLQPVGENETGKVVVTDVYNDLVPVVRYDTGDYAMVSKYRDGQLFSIKKIAGRVSEEISATNGTPVSSLSLGPYIHQPFSEADIPCQFQFAQVGKRDYEFRIMGTEDNMMLTIAGKVTEGLKTVLGKDATIKTVFLPEIEPLPSGKRPLYRNEMNN